MVKDEDLPLSIYECIMDRMRENVGWSDFFMLMTQLYFMVNRLSCGWVVLNIDGINTTVSVSD